MALGRRCEAGCESWPDDPRYKVCPICGEATKRYRNLSPLDKSEALHAEFEAFYAAWDDEHDPDRLTPVADDPPYNHTVPARAT